MKNVKNKRYKAHFIVSNSTTVIPPKYKPVTNDDYLNFSVKTQPKNESLDSYKLQVNYFKGGHPEWAPSFLKYLETVIKVNNVMTCLKTFFIFISLLKGGFIIIFIL